MKTIKRTSSWNRKGRGINFEVKVSSRRRRREYWTRWSRTWRCWGRGCWWPWSWCCWWSNRLVRRGTLNAEAKTINHLLTHRYKSPYYIANPVSDRKWNTHRGAFKRKLKALEIWWRSTSLTREETWIKVSWEQDGTFYAQHVWHWRQDRYAFAWIAEEPLWAVVWRNPY